MAVELRKGQKVNLEKKGPSLGEILINLNWSKPQKKRGFFSFNPQPIDLDLGCLFELQDGTRGCVQALGNAFGSLNTPLTWPLTGTTVQGPTPAGKTFG